MKSIGNWTGPPLFPVGWWNGTHFYNGSTWIVGSSNRTFFWYDNTYVRFIEYYISYDVWKSNYWNGTYFFNGTKWVVESDGYFLFANGTSGRGRVCLNCTFACSTCSQIGGLNAFSGGANIYSGWVDITKWKIDYEPELYSSFEYLLE